MKSALSVVNLLLDAQIMRVCSACEQEFGPVPAEPGVQKSHGLCRRHALEAYGNAGVPLEMVHKQPDSAFAPDLSESVDASVAQRFAQDTGLTLHPQVQYGAVSAATVEQLPPEKRQQFAALANWEFTDRRPDQPSQGISFYVPVNATYEQMMQRWNEKKQEFGV
jgi:hypothetical protein